LELCLTTYEFIPFQALFRHIIPNYNSNDERKKREKKNDVNLSLQNQYIAVF